MNPFVNAYRIENLRGMCDNGNKNTKEAPS